jgi:hypothetical protein
MGVDWKVTQLTHNGNILFEIFTEVARLVPGGVGELDHLQ